MNKIQTKISINNKFQVVGCALGKARLKCDCISCDNWHIFEVGVDDLIDYKIGKKDATTILSSLKKEHRDILVTGLCKKCTTVEEAFEN